MPYGTKCGVFEANLTAGTEVSSTYEGRHLTFVESELTHANPGDALVDKGQPVLVGENIVGVAFKSAIANTDLIAIDTEGIWNLSVVATDEDGNNAVVAGDELFINKTTCIISKNSDKGTHARFGYALGAVSASNTAVIAVKVHWNPDDGMELVGYSTNFVAIGTKNNAREYRYRSTAVSGDVRGQYMALALNGAGGSGEAHRGRTIVEAVGVLVAHGGHHGVEFDTDGTITGLGVGHRATFMCPNRAAMATIAGGMSELWAEGDATNFAAATVHSIHRFVVDGDVTGRATAQNAFEFANIPTGAGTQYMLDTGQNGVASTDGLRVIINGAVYMMLLVSI